jgi:hypothetical protein
MLSVLGRIFSFRDFQQHHPAESPPGDMLDASFDALIRRIGELEARIDAFLRADGKLAAGTVTPDALAFPLAGKTGKTAFSVGPVVQNPRIGVEAGSSSDSSAEIWAYASKDWAEHMPGTIPDGSMTAFDITGDHWSARWWANFAARIVQNAPLPATPGHSGAWRRLDMSGWVFNDVNTLFPLIDALSLAAVTPTQAVDVFISLDGAWLEAGVDYTLMLDHIQLTSPPRADSSVFGQAYVAVPAA